jgi:hypothetical protein
MQRAISILSIVAAVTLGLVAGARAQPHEDVGLRADVEVDPLAFALRGYSLHVGLGAKRMRVDLGAFALEYPKFLEPHAGVETASNGFGAKFQYFLFAEQRGGFVGVDLSVGRQLLEAATGDVARRDLFLNLGGHVGWRFVIARGFYVTPWVGLAYDVLADDVRLGGKTYDARPLVPFVTLHVGYRIR